MSENTNARSRVATHLWFPGDAQEAVKFYVALVPNSRIVQSFRFGDAGPQRNQSYTSQTFELDGQRYMALSGSPFQFNAATSIFLRCQTQDEVDRYWNALVEGGAAQQCGWLTDRWGLSWQIAPEQLGEMLQDKDPARAKRVMDAMMGMIKLDLPALQHAYDG